MKPVVNMDHVQSKLTAFSISQIDGAFCDDGQNYKNVVTLVKGLGKYWRKE